MLLPLQLLLDKAWEAGEAGLPGWMVALRLFWNRAGVPARFRWRALSLGLYSGADVTAAVFPRSLQYTCLAQVCTEWKGCTGMVSCPCPSQWPVIRLQRTRRQQKEQKSENSSLCLLNLVRPNPLRYLFVRGQKAQEY